MSLGCYAQWNSISSYAGGAAYSTGSFVIDGKAYVGGGNPSLSSFFEYDPSSDTWTSLGGIAGGVNRASPIAFAIDGKGYFGCGGDQGSPSTMTVVEYDPSTDNWELKGDFEGGNRHSAFSTSANGKGYCIGGNNGGGTTDEVWEYDPSDDSWTEKSAFPGGAIYWLTGFVIDGKIYVGGGSSNAEYHRYNPANDSWKQIADFPGATRSAAVGFAVGNRGYVGGGVDDSWSNVNDFYEYNPDDDEWNEVDSLAFPGAATAWSTVFVMDKDVYMGTGAAMSGSITPSSEYYHAKINAPDVDDPGDNDPPAGISSVRADVSVLYFEPMSRQIRLRDRSSENQDVTVYDLQGRSLQAGTINGSDPIDANKWTPGLYIIELSDQQGQVTSHKIMVH